MKKTFLIILLAAIGIGNAHAQTRVIVRRPIRHVIAPAARTVIVSRPVRRIRPAVIVRPVVTLVRPAARRGVVVVRR